MRVVIASLSVIGSFTLPAPAAGQARGAGASGKGACSLLPPPFLGCSDPQFNEIRGQRVVCEPPRLASAKVRQAHGHATLRTMPFL
jgi:hypothetical protein